MKIVIYSMPILAIVMIVSSLTIQRFEAKNPTEDIAPPPEGIAIFNKMRAKSENKTARSIKQNTGTRHHGPAPVIY